MEVTAALAAAALRVEVGQIVKSLVFLSGAEPNRCDGSPSYGPLPAHRTTYSRSGRTP